MARTKRNTILDGLKHGLCVALMPLYTAVVHLGSPSSSESEVLASFASFHFVVVIILIATVDRRTAMLLSIINISFTVYA